MTYLSIRALGPLEIKLDGEPVSGFESDKVRALLVFLAVAEARPHRREKLAALLWPERPERSARANLRCALANLRKVLGDRDAAQPFLLVTRQTIQFNPDCNAWVDVVALADLLSGGSFPPFNQAPDALADPETIRRLEEAVELYRGEFLEGFSLADSAAFDEWAVFQQEQLHHQVMEALCCLGGWYESRGELEQALHHAWRQLELDPWRESGHRQVMRLLAYSGQRSAALVQYRVCCQVLDEELGAMPEEETVQLYERIRDGALEVPAVVLPGSQVREPAPRPPRFLEEHESESLVLPVFVARERELERLHHLLEKAIGGQGQVVFVTGGPGRGKTALLDEFARQAMDAHPDLLVADGKCSAYAEMGDPYLPFRDILSMLTGDVEARWRAGVISRDHTLRLWNALPLAAQTLLQRGSQVIPVLLSGTALLSRAMAAVPAGTSWLPQLQEHIEHQESQLEKSEQTRLFQQAVTVLHGLAELHPLLLILDDLQWIDTASACLLFHLGQRLGGSRILIAGAYRPEELVLRRPSAPDLPLAAGERERHPLEKVLGEFKRRYGDVWIDLSTVNASEARRFVDLFLDTEPNCLGEGFRESLFQRAGGHPLFTIEMLRLMQERGDLLQDKDGRWIEGPALDWQILPARVEAVIEERISRLDDDLRQLLAVASVEGAEFTADVLAQVRGQGELEILQRLSGELENRHRLVREWGMQTAGPRRLVRYRFAHALIQRYLYDHLSVGERMLLHRQIAGILESLYEGSTGEIAAQLAYHYAGDVDRERYYARLAGERAEATYAHGEAARYLGRALELTPEKDHAERYALLLAREGAYHRQGCRDLQRRDLDDLRQLAAVLQDGQKQAEVALRQSDYDRVTGSYAAAIEAAQSAVALARDPVRERSDQDAYFEAAGHLQWGKALRHQGEYETARAQFEHALAVARAIPEMTGVSSGPPIAGEGRDASPVGPVVDRPGEPLDGAAGRWRRLAADSYRCLGVVCWHLGQNDAARAHYRRALRIYGEIKDRWGQATAVNGLGVIAWSQGSPAEAQACFEQSRRYHEEVGDRRGQCRALANLGDVVIYQGDYSEARRLLGQCLPICREIGEPWIESGVLANLGVVADRMGVYAEALAYLQQALDMRREIGDRQGEAEGLSDLALVYHHIGDSESSLACSEQSISITQELNDSFILGFALTRMGHALVSMDLLDKAATAYREAFLLRKEGGHAHLEAEPLAGLARVALAQGDSAWALDHVEEILHHLKGDNLNGNDEPLRVYLTCYQVLCVNGDPRAEEILDAAYHLLQERAARIDLEKLRRSFLENVAAHREIVTSWKAVQ
jgi:DNA-binding SARP family transcriptional activator/predicted ATPase